MVCVEHDLSILDYLSDYVCVLYGEPGAYGVVTMPFSVREGINVFLAGFVPTENLRFRDVELNFKVVEDGRQAEDAKAEDRDASIVAYPAMTKTLTSRTKGTTFVLHICAGTYSASEIIVLLGENGTGKTTFIRMLAGIQKPDGDDSAVDEPGVMPVINVSYKPQKISPRFEGSVRDLLHRKIRGMAMHPQFMTDVSKPLRIEELLDRDVQTLSGGELQRVAIALSLGTPADVYLIDEPSAYLDSEQRIHASRVIKRFILHSKKTGFIVEHDFIMATYLADRVIVYDGTPGVECWARRPQSLLTGMNAFLEHLEITFRRDPANYRPRINKYESQMDLTQKRTGDYFFVDD